MNLPAPRRYTARQIVVAVALLVAAAAVGLMVGSNRYDLTLLGLAFFCSSAVIVCKLDDTIGD